MANCDYYNKMLAIYKKLYIYLKSMDKELIIKLTADEHKIFGKLKKYRDELKLNTVLRVAGGWVRDKVIYILCCLGYRQGVQRY